MYKEKEFKFQYSHILCLKYNYICTSYQINFEGTMKIYKLEFWCTIFDNILCIYKHYTWYINPQNTWLCVYHITCIVCRPVFRITYIIKPTYLLAMASGHKPSMCIIHIRSQNRNITHCSIYIYRCFVKTETKQNGVGLTGTVNLIGISVTYSLQDCLL